MGIRPVALVVTGILTLLVKIETRLMRTRRRQRGEPLDTVLRVTWGRRIEITA